jgi:hypothetical protein
MSDKVDLEVKADQEHECYAEEAYVALDRLSSIEGDHVIARYLMTRGMKVDERNVKVGMGESACRYGGGGGA